MNYKAFRQKKIVETYRVVGEEVSMELSQKLQHRRKEMNLTQEEVAEKIHVSRQTISNWETGRTLPDINSLVLISNIYDISLDNLIKEDIEVIKQLSSDTKQGEQWFTLSCLLSNFVGLLIVTQKGTLETNLVVLLLILEAVIISYIGFFGYSFLKRTQETVRKKHNASSDKYVIDMNHVLYAATILCGSLIVISTALIMG